MKVPSAPEPTGQVRRTATGYDLALTTSDASGEFRLDLRLSESAGVTELIFVHQLDTVDGVRDFGPGWEYYLDRLVAERLGQPPPEWDNYPAQSAYYERVAARALA